MSDPELQEHRVPWRPGNSNGYQLVEVYRRGNGNFAALTVSVSHAGHIAFTRWEWQNHYGRDWSRGDGAWSTPNSYGNDAFTLAELKKALQIVEGSSHGEVQTHQPANSRR